MDIVTLTLMNVNGEMIAHRGYSRIATENTLTAFQKALEFGAHSLEFDVQLSADGIPVIFHDQSLNRMSGISGTIREKTINDLQKLRIAQNEKIPTLESVSFIFEKVPSYLYFDIKIHQDWTENEIKTFLQQLNQYSWQDKAIITCFNESFLNQCRHFDSQIKLGYFLVKIEDYEQQLAKAKQANAVLLSVYYPVILERPKMIQKTRSNNIDIVVWTVDDQTILKKLQDLGIRRIISNDLSIF